MNVCTFVHILEPWRSNGTFADAALVLYDDLALTTRDLGDYGEERFATVGLDPLGRILVVVYTWREQRARIISARPATPAERKRYESKR